MYDDADDIGDDDGGYGFDDHEDDDDDDVSCLHLAGWGSYNRGVYWKAIR